MPAFDLWDDLVWFVAGGGLGAVLDRFASWWVKYRELNGRSRLK